MNFHFDTSAKLFLLLSMLCSLIDLANAGQKLKPSYSHTKMTLAELKRMPETRELTVKFRDDHKVRLKNGKWSGLSEKELAELTRALSASGLKNAKWDEPSAGDVRIVDQNREDAQKNTDEELADLNNFHTLPIPQPLSSAEVAHKLNGLDFIEHAELTPGPAPVGRPRPSQDKPVEAPKPGVHPSDEKNK